MEFVFYNTDENQTFTVTQEQYDDFVFIHSESGQPNEEWLNTPPNNDNTINTIAIG